MKIITSVEKGIPKIEEIDKIPMYRGQHPCEVPKSFRKRHPNYVLYMYSDPDWDTYMTTDLYGKPCKLYHHEWDSFSDTASWCKNIEVFSGKFDENGIPLYKKCKEFYVRG